VGWPVAEAGVPRRGAEPMGAFACTLHTGLQNLHVISGACPLNSRAPRDSVCLLPRSRRLSARDSGVRVPPFSFGMSVAGCRTPIACESRCGFRRLEGPGPAMEKVNEESSRAGITEE
jgi:hypothetical protein